MHPQILLIAANNANPGAWAKIDAMRQGMKGRWPSHIFLPRVGADLAYWSTTVDPVHSGHPSPSAIHDSDWKVDQFLALASWRISQGVYQFSPEEEGLLWASDIFDRPDASFCFSDLPNLPDWAPYVRLNQPRIGLSGFFLAPTYRDDRVELVLLLDHETGMIPILLSPDSAASPGDGDGEGDSDSDDILAAADRWLDQFSGSDSEAERYENILFGLMPLALELLRCSAGRMTPGNQSAVKSGGSPSRGLAVMNRNGDERMFPPSKPRLWLVANEK